MPQDAIGYAKEKDKKAREDFDKRRETLLTILQNHSEELEIDVAPGLSYTVNGVFPVIQFIDMKGKPKPPKPEAKSEEPKEEAPKLEV